MVAWLENSPNFQLWQYSAEKIIENYANKSFKKANFQSSILQCGNLKNSDCQFLREINIGRFCQSQKFWQFQRPWFFFILEKLYKLTKVKFISIQSVEKWEIYSQWQIISWNQLVYYSKVKRCFHEIFVKKV